MGQEGEVLRYHHNGRKTELAYVRWIKSFGVSHLLLLYGSCCLIAPNISVDKTLAIYRIAFSLIVPVT